MSEPARAVPATGVPATGLVARSRPIAPDAAGALDLAAAAADGGVVWMHGDAGFAGWGVAARITVRAGGLARAAVRAAEVLESIAVAGGPGPLAFGALPFRPGAPGELVVPATLIRRDERGAWLTRVGPAGSAPEERWPSALPEPAGPEARPAKFAVEAVTPPGAWQGLVRRALDVIAVRELDKVVVARAVDVVADRPIRVDDLVRRLHQSQPAAMVFAAPGFVGASPELLVARTGRDVWSHPLAGTAGRSGDRAGDGRVARGLLASDKERREHRAVVDAVAAVLGAYCSHLDVPDAPSVVSSDRVAHLGTRLHGILRHPPASALALAAALHPTPAVAGVPLRAALSFIATEEDVDRGRYAGPVGWVDAAGDGQWAVGIRSAEIRGTRARLWAGNGIVAGSDPEAELTENQLKLRPLLDALIRP